MADKFDIRDEPAWDPWEDAASRVENPDIYATFARIINAQKWTGTIKVEPSGTHPVLGAGYGQPPDWPDQCQKCRVGTLMHRVGQGWLCNVCESGWR